MSEELNDELDFDFSDIINFIKNNKQLVNYAILTLLIGIGVWVRTLSISHYNNRLLGLDPYVFYRYAKTLITNGSLPYIDSLRYFPDGFITFKEHQVITYFISGLYLLFHPLFGGDLINYDIIYPVISFAISMVFFYLMIKELFNNKTALLSVGFLSLAPSYLFRTIAGFADKEAMATMLWFSSLYFLFKSLKEVDYKKIITYSLISGVISGLSGLTWGGTKFVYISIGSTFILITLFNKLTNREAIIYYLWLIPTLVMNATMTLRYDGWSLVTNDMFIIPFIGGLIIGLRLIINHFKISFGLPKKLSFLIIVTIISIIGLFVLQITGFNVINKYNEIIKTIIVPFGDCPFCVSVTENQAPWFIDPVRSIDWWHGLQWFIPLFVIGTMLLLNDIFNKFNKKLRLGLISSALIFILFFMFSRFVNNPSFNGINKFFEVTYLFTLPLFGFTLLLIFILSKENKWKNINISKLIIFFWIAISVIATRGAIRVVFASTPVFVLLSAYALTRIASIIYDKTKDNFYTSIPYFIGIAILLWGANYCFHSGSNFWPSFTNDWLTAMNWVKNNTDPNAVFTHWWDYGYWVQTMGDRATTVDGGNFRVDWDEIIGGHLFSAYNLTEAYDSLTYFSDKSGHKPDYFLIVDDDVLKYVQMANIGGKPGFFGVFAWNGQQAKNTYYKPDKFDLLIPLQAVNYGMLSKDFVFNNKLWPVDGSFVVNVLIPFNSTSSERGNPLIMLYNTFDNSKAIMPINCICEMNKGCYNITNTGLPECIEFINGGAIYIPSKLSNRLFTQLYLLNKSIPGFHVVYSTPAGLNIQTITSQQDPTDITIYRINYTEMKKWVDNGSPAW